MCAIYPVILSGGSGTRLWPLSRSLYPKQFIRFFDGQGPSFLGATLNRLLPDAGFRPPTVLCNSDHRFLVQEETERAGTRPRAIILEPVARNTAVAIAVAALSVADEDPSGVLVVMPSDHVIKDTAGFVASVRDATRVADTGRLVLFGIPPDGPNTGYGYIRRGEPLQGFDGWAFRVAAFVEKPDRAAARSYVDAGDYLWNSGIFVFQARTFLDELARLEPCVVEAARDALASATQEFGFLRLGRAAMERSPNSSVDHAVMERTTAAAVLPIDIGWSDVGSWLSLWELVPRDGKGNFIHGEAVLEDTSGCYVHSDQSLISTIGVQNLIIVDTPDALLVADMSRAQDVSKLVAGLKQSNRREHERHLRDHRPWGYFETLSIGPRFQVKLLHINPGGKLSLQLHHHRSEHWVVVQGAAKVVIGDTEKFVGENESVYIVASQWHRLENPGQVPLKIIEVQIGGYLGEDDILRADDVYHRMAEEAT